MSRTQTMSSVDANGTHNRIANGKTVANGGVTARGTARNQTTDRSRWRLKDDKGVHTWAYLEDDEEARKWPQSTADKYYMGLDTVWHRLPFRALEASCSFNDSNSKNWNWSTGN